MWHSGLEFGGFRKQKNPRRMTVSMEMVRMAQSRPRKNQSERSEFTSELPLYIVMDYNISCKGKLFVGIMRYTSQKSKTKPVPYYSKYAALKEQNNL